MGNSGSSASTLGDAGGAEGSGVTLSANLQKTIVNDFNAKVHAAWIQRSAARKQEEEANSELGRQHQQFLKKNSAVQTKLDERMDTLSAKFHDKVVSADYDASQLQQKYLKAEALGSGGPCDDVRNNYVSCQKNYSAVDCKIFVDALQDCVGKAISQH